LLQINLLLRQGECFDLKFLYPAVQRAGNVIYKAVFILRGLDVVFKLTDFGQLVVKPEHLKNRGSWQFLYTNGDFGHYSRGIGIGSREQPSDRHLDEVNSRLASAKAKMQAELWSLGALDKQEEQIEQLMKDTDIPKRITRLFARLDGPLPVLIPNGNLDQMLPVLQYASSASSASSAASASSASSAAFSAHSTSSAPCASSTAPALSASSVSSSSFSHASGPSLASSEAGQSELVIPSFASFMDAVVPEPSNTRPFEPRPLPLFSATTFSLVCTSRQETSLEKDSLPAKEGSRGKQTSSVKSKTGGPWREITDEDFAVAGLSMAGSSWFSTMELDKKKEICMKPSPDCFEVPVWGRGLRKNAGGRWNDLD
jgi:hypothetical protein